jgi:GxxExxY protein
MEENMKHRRITEQVIKAFYALYNALGYGFLEKCYERALVIELEKMNLNVETQSPITVYYDNQVIGEYKADIVVENIVILELKAAKAITEEHTAQLLNYLRATPMEVCLLLNFGPKAEFARRSFDNNRKSNMPLSSKSS